MSIQAMTWVFEEVRGFKPAERLVLLAIANHADKRTREAFPSIELIAEEADMSVATVYRVLSSLESTGIVKIERHAGGSRTRAEWRPNLYVLNFDVTSPPAGHRTHGGIDHHADDCQCRACRKTSQVANGIAESDLASCENQGSQLATTDLASCWVEPSVEPSEKQPSSVTDPSPTAPDGDRPAQLFVVREPPAPPKARKARKGPSEQGQRANRILTAWFDEAKTRGEPAPTAIPFPALMRTVTQLAAVWSDDEIAQALRTSNAKSLTALESEIRRNRGQGGPRVKADGRIDTRDNATGIGRDGDTEIGRKFL